MVCKDGVPWWPSGLGHYFMALEVRSSNPDGSHQFLKPGPINFKDPQHLDEMTSGEEMESRERRWKAERRDGK